MCPGFGGVGSRDPRAVDQALIVYALGLAVHVPFAVLPQYVGPIAERLHDVEVRGRSAVLGMEV